jgi:hypothetical protein
MSLRGFIAAARYHNMNLLEFLGEFVGPLLVLLGVNGVIRTITGSYIITIVGMAAILGIVAYIVELRNDGIPQNRHTTLVAFGLISALLIRMFILR